MGCFVLAALTACGGQRHDPSPGDVDATVGGADATTVTDAAGDPAGDASITPDAGTVIDAPPAGECASPPQGNFAGDTRFTAQGGSGQQHTDAAVTWTLVSSEGCVDRYAPSGTVRRDDSGPSCEQNVVSSHAIAATDGTLLVDRRTAPPTYDMIGETTWAYTTTCAEPTTIMITAGWASYAGVVDEGLAYGRFQRNSSVFDWSFARVGSELPQSTGCEGAAQASWITTHSVTGSGTDDLTAHVTWTLTGTDGCTDTYRPDGTATIVVQPQFPCTMAHTIDPDSGAVEATDATLTVDRTLNPPSFDVRGSVGWPVTVHCTHDDGTTQTYPSTVGLSWHHGGTIVGAVAAATLRLSLVEEAVRIERAP